MVLGKNDEIENRRLVIKSFHIDKVRVSSLTSIEGRILNINKDLIDDLVEAEPLIEKIDINIIEPADYNRWTNSIMDIIPISVKVLGEGITHTITGAYFMLTGVDSEGVQVAEFSWSEGILEEQLVLNKVGTPSDTDIIISFDVVLKAGEGNPLEQRPQLPIDTSRHVTSSARRTRTVRRWCSGATWKSRSPTSRASQRKTRRPSATGIAKPRRLRAIYSYPNAMPSRCRRTSARRCYPHRARPRIPRGRQSPATRRGARIVRERARPASFPVQGVAVRHLAGGHAVENLADGLGDPRLRSGERLSALPGRLVQSGARADGKLHRRRRHLPAAGQHRRASSSKTARPPVSNSTTGARCAPGNSSLQRSTCTRLSKR